MEDYQNDEDRERDVDDEDSYPEDGIVPTTYTDDPISRQCAASRDGEAER